MWHLNISFWNQRLLNRTAQKKGNALIIVAIYTQKNQIKQKQTTRITKATIKKHTSKKQKYFPKKKSTNAKINMKKVNVTNS